MFSSWFNRGFLVLRRIDWSTPASILETIIRYEAVHRIHGWDDLRRRIDPPDRRCYAFFHPALVDDPLIFVEVALTREIPGAIDPILTVNGEPPEPQQPTTAVFYSISNCQRGLSRRFVRQLPDQAGGRGDRARISQAHALRHAVAGAGICRLAAPRAARRKHSKAIKPEDRDALTARRDRGLVAAPSREPLKDPLMRAAAWYFLHAKTRNGAPVDPVARFHLGNGARLERHQLARRHCPRTASGSRTG